MRLIDADKLKTTAVLGVQLQHADSRYYYFYEEETIEKAPTVEAIPKEWLLNHMEVGNDEQNKVVHDLVKLWEKENEHKESD